MALFSAKTIRPKLPPGPEGPPLIGCGPEMTRDPLAFMCKLTHDYGPISTARFGPNVLYCVSHPDLLEELFLGRNRDCVKDMTTRELMPLLGKGLLTSEGELWRRQRKLAAPPLQPKRIEAYANTMVDIAERHVAKFRADEVRDVHTDMMTLTLEIVAETLLGFDGRRDAERVSAALEDVLAYYGARLFSLQGLLPSNTPTPAYFRFRRAVSELDAIVYRMIARCRVEGSTADHLLARLLNARTETGESMSDEQAHDEAITMLLAGHETTALSLTYALFALSNHPECQARLREELAQLGAARPTVSDIARLPYLDAVIRETARLYPPAWAIGREVVTPFELGGYELPRGTQIITSPFALHRDARYFPEPTKFSPERWLDGKQAGLPRYAYIPFGLGARSCIGIHFAKMELALVLATVLQQVSLQVVPGYRLELEPIITMRPKHGMPMIVRRLRQAAMQRGTHNPSLAPPLVVRG